MGDYQGGVSVGAGVGTTSTGSDRGSARDVLGPDEPAGQALWLAIAAFAILYMITGGAGGGIVGRLGAMARAIVAGAAVIIAVNYLSRTYVLTHPDAPFADGFRIVV